MTTLHNDRDVQPGQRKRDEDMKILTARFDEHKIYVTLEDSREIAVPLWWYPRLYRATPSQREHWEHCGGGRGLHWPDIDEDLDVHGFIHGLKAPGAKPPAEQ